MMTTILAALLSFGSFLEPSNLPGCSFYPRPACWVPDTPDREFRPEDRRYVWPLENNNPPLRVKYVEQPNVYGPRPSDIPHSICIIDEPLNEATCYSLWEISAVAYCRTDRWLGMGYDLESDTLRYEHPVFYFEYRAPMRVLFWEFKDKPNSFPVVYAPQPNPNTPRFTFGVHVDRIQQVKQTNFIGSSTQVMLLIRESDTTPLFRDVFEWFPGSGGNAVYGGGTGVIPQTDTQASACVSQIVLSNYCGVNPNRPECQSPI